ncbi:MAG: type IV secretion system DNA-binding domain-containing protein [Polaribacter sp.]|nr:type IV secretion system DNA-binding domain-containing protein [Polaribacter sp.]
MGEGGLMVFPIRNIKENRMKLRSGVVSYVHRLNVPDQDQFDKGQVGEYLTQTSSWLNTLKQDQWVRFMSVNGDLNLISDMQHINSSHLGAEPNKRPLRDLNLEGILSQNPSFPGDYVSFNSELHRFIKIYKLPDTINPCYLMQFEGSILNFKKLNSLRAKRFLNYNRKIHFSNLTKNIRDIESENTYSESEQILEEIINGKQSLFECELWLTVSGTGLDELNHKTSELKEVLDLSDIGYLIENKNISNVFSRDYLFDKPRFTNPHLINTCYLAELFPMSNEKIDDKGISFYSQSSEEVRIDTNNPNAINNHGMITGASGSGKSFCLNKILFEELSQGAKGIVFDFEKSFLRTTQYFNGVVFDKTFNPLQFKDPKYIKAVLMSFIPKSELSTKLEGEVFILIKEYLGCTEVHTFRGLIDYINKAMEGFRYFFEEYLDHFDDIHRDTKDIYFVDINLYPIKVVPALILYMIETFKSLEGRRIMILEECWNLLSSVSSFVEEFYRTFRKKNASVWAVSQGFDDFTSSSVGKVVIQNSNHKLLFSQNVLESEFLSKFDTESIHLAKSSRGEYSEFYYKSQSTRKTVRYVASALEYELFNTSHGDSDLLNDFINDHIDYFGFRACVEKFTRINNA